MPFQPYYGIRLTEHGKQATGAQRFGTETIALRTTNRKTAKQILNNMAEQQKSVVRKKKKNRTWLWILLGLGILIAWGALAKSMGWVGKKKLTKVVVEKAAKRTIIETVSASGKLYPELEVNISSDVSGEVVELLVAEGDSIRKGQLLGRIKPDTYKSVVERAEAAVNSAKSNEANAKARIAQSESRIAQANARRVQIENQINLAHKTFNRNKQLHTDGIVSDVELENAENALKSLEADLRAFDADMEGLRADLKASKETVTGSGYNVKSAEASLKEAKENLSKTSIYAPVSGVLSALNIEKGERVVGTLQMAGTQMMTIADFTNMEVRVDVSENDILRVEKGDTAIIEIDAYSDRTFKGIVKQVAKSAKQDALSAATDQITNFEVEIRLLHNSYKDLLKTHRFPFRPGMSANVDIRTHTITGVLAVPIQSVTARAVPDSLKKNIHSKEEELREVVFITNNNKVLSRDVTTGIQDESYIQVTSGLQEGEEIVTAPYQAISKDLEDDMDIKIVDKEELYKKKKK